MLVADLFIVTISFSLTYIIFFNLIKESFTAGPFLALLGICLLVQTIFFLLFNSHRGILRYSTYRDYFRIFGAVFFANLALYLINDLIFRNLYDFIFPNSGFVVNLIVSFGLLFIFRIGVRFLFDMTKILDTQKNKCVQILVYGTDPSKVDMVQMIQHNKYIPYVIAGFISGEAAISDKTILNLPVFCQKDLFPGIIEEYSIKSILLDPRELDREEKQSLAEKCQQHNVDLLSTSSIEEWSYERSDKKIKKIKKVQIEDLLGRIPIAIDHVSIGKNLEGKTILITGAAGSIGSEIVRQLCRFSPQKLLLCDSAETPLHNLCLEIREKFPKINFTSFLSDVRNYEQMQLIIRMNKPQYIYHAAAYKHVPLLEEQPCEAVLTNVMGSKNIADLAIKFKAEVLVMISTDKAVNPSNVMGASKRIAEMYVQSLGDAQKKESEGPHTRIITTRFGNVLGSNGSVIPLFEEQIKKGGPITVTDKNIIRYFMTIREACRLVLEAGNFGKGGEVFVFDMGDPVKIKDMAEEMIRLSGLVPYQDIDIVYTGLRPGEKLYEELLYNGETMQPTHNKKIKIGTVQRYDHKEIFAPVELLIKTAQTYNCMETVRAMKKIAPEFVSQNSPYADMDSPC